MALVLAAALLGVTSAPAQAHAVLVHSTPVDGSRLAASPTQVVLDFDERIQLVPGTAKVVSVTGHEVELPGAAVSSAGDAVVIPLQRDLPRGSYLVTWRVVSADSHIVSGSIVFGVREAPSSAPAASGTPFSSLSVLDGAARTAEYAGLVLGVGVLLTGALLWPDTTSTRRARVLGRLGLSLVAVSAVVQIADEGALARESGWAGLLRLDGIGQTLASTFGRALVIELVLCAALGLLGATATRWRRGPGLGPGLGVTVVLSAALLVACALTGHADSGSDRALALTMTSLHLAAMTLWIGGLVCLLALVLPTPTESATADRLGSLGRWSNLAYLCVAVLIVTGEYQAWRQIQPLDSLWSTRYGVVLLVKLCLVAGVLAAAFAAQRHVRRVGLTGARPERDVVRRSVRAELALLALVMVVTSVLVAQQPASSSYGPVTRREASLGSDGVLNVRIDPTRRGPQEITVEPLDRAGRPLHLQTLAATLSSADFSAIDLRLVRGPSQTWHTVGAVVPLPGVWTLTFDVSIDRAAGDATRVQYDVW